MSTLLDGLTLYLRLDRLDGGRFLDLSGAGRSGTPLGNPTIVADDLFGYCVQLNGQSDAVILPPSAIPAGNQMTMCLWLYGADGLPKDTVSFCALSGDDQRTVLMHLPWGDGHIYFDCGNTGPLYDRISQAAQPTDYKGGWVHWAFTKNATTGEMHIWRNGAHWLGGTGFTKSIQSSARVMLGAMPSGPSSYGYFYLGKAAHLRIFNRALSGGEIAQIMDEDETALAAFRKSYPLDVALLDEDQQATLYIVDEASDHRMHLEISNVSGREIQIQPTGNTVVSAANHHVRVHFRPGTLAATVTTIAEPLINTALSEKGWTARLETQPDGSVSLYLLKGEASSLQIRETLQLALPGLRADGMSGARNTRVEVHFQGLMYAGEAQPLRWRRTIHLSILNESGRRDLPLHVGFSGTNAVLNDGSTPNILTLHLRNIQDNHGIPISPANSNRPTQFIISFDVDKANTREEYALGSSSQVNAISAPASVTGPWSIAKKTQGGNTTWIITTSSKTALGPNEMIEIPFGNIVTDLPTAKTNVYVDYRNVAGYRDGQISATIQKSPLLFRGATGTSVNIGTPNATNDGVKLGVSAGSSMLQLRREATESTGGKVLFMELSQQDGVPPRVPVVYPSLRFSHSNRYAHRIEAREDGLYFKTGDLNSDTLVNISANTAKVTELTANTVRASGDGYIGNHFFWSNSVLRNDQGGSLELGGYDSVKGTGTPYIDFHFRDKQEDFNTRIINDADKQLTVQATTLRVLGNIGLGGNNALQQGINFQLPSTRVAIASGATIQATMTTSDAIRVVGGQGGVLAAGANDVLLWGMSTTNPGKGNVLVKGILSATDKWFRITHPAKPGYELIHACLEGPESAVYYRGEAKLKNGRAQICLPEYFEALTRKEGRTVQLTPKGDTPFLLSYEAVTEGGFWVHGSLAEGEFAWEVKAVRADVGELQTEIRADGSYA